MAALPEELTEEILSRLPVKSILKFKSASKKWYSLLSQDHEFAKFQLKQSTLSSCASKNLILYQSHDGAIFRCWDVDDSNASRKIKFPVLITMPCQAIGSANGLICVAPSMYIGDFCYIWNPCTDECKKISVPFQDPGCTLFGFGYDLVSDDYKLIGDWSFHYGVFSLKTKSWKILEYSSKYVAGRMSNYAFYSNGALHWCVDRQIIAFDLSKEQILFLDLPTEEEDPQVHLFDYQGSLCVSGKSIWVMKEYGNSKSWVKLNTPEEYAKPVCISSHGELVFCGDGGCVKSDIQGRMSDEDSWLVQNYVDSFVYKESLISPNCVSIRN